ncbi:MAG: ABC transporter ATP-binding protein [Spirochaetia bacterium]|nr:ABC transporter ATP-binding protein [Spirochaetia bacterium]
MSVILETKKLVKTYKSDEVQVEVLKGVDLIINKGDFLSIRGSSGVGKSTLLNILGALDKADSGEVCIEGKTLNSYFNEDGLHLYRREKVGFIFQNHYLMSDFTVLENVMMPLLLNSVDRKTAKNKALEVLDNVGLKERAKHYPSQISGGESQRAAVARAIVHEPPIVLADEPTGNLDTKNSENFVDIFARLQKERDLTVLVVTHDMNLADKADKRFKLYDGLLFTV